MGETMMEARAAAADMAIRNYQRLSEENPDHSLLEYCEMDDNGRLVVTDTEEFYEDFPPTNGNVDDPVYAWSKYADELGSAAGRLARERREQQFFSPEEMDEEERKDIEERIYSSAVGNLEEHMTGSWNRFPLFEPITGLQDSLSNLFSLNARASADKPTVRFNIEYQSNRHYKRHGDDVINDVVREEEMAPLLDETLDADVHINSSFPRHKSSAVVSFHNIGILEDADDLEEAASILDAQLDDLREGIERTVRSRLGESGEVKGEVTQEVENRGWVVEDVSREDRWRRP